MHAQVDQENITMSDYSCLIKPKSDREWTAYKVAGAATKSEQEARLKEDLETELQSSIKGSQIAEIQGEKFISIAWDEREIISLWRMQIMHLVQLEAALKVYMTARGTSGTGDLRPLTAALERQALTSSKIRSLNHGPSRKHWVPVAAFVTFESDDHYNAALALRHMTVATTSCIIEQAPEPETIIHDHLQYSHFNRNIRSGVVLFVTIAMLLGGVWAILQSNAFKEAQSYTDQCEYVVGKNAELGSELVCPGAENRVYKWSDGDAEAREAKLYRAAYEKLKNLLPYRDFPRVRDHLTSLPHGKVCARTVTSSSVTIAGRSTVVSNVSWPSWQPSADGLSANCHRVDSASSATFVLYEDGDVDAMCYACICSVSSESVKTSDYCELYNKDTNTAQNWGLLATVLVVVVNQILKQSIVFSAPQLRAHTKEEEMQSKVLRIFLVQLTNTAILVLLTKSTLGPFRDLPGEHYKSVNAKWYANIAAPMVTTMAIQFLTPLIFHIVLQLVVGVALRGLARYKAKTQNQLNAALAPKSRDL
jgi:hypothetical protein